MSILRVKVIGYTQPTEEFKKDSSCSHLDDIISYCARVSNPDNQDNWNTSEKLLQYLLKHKHFSPFEMVNVVLEIETTRDIARQMLRHRSMCFQEYSQRYADPLKDLEFILPREVRLQDSKNRQNSIELKDDSHLQELWNYEVDSLVAKVKQIYNWAISHGIAKECVRSILPEGLIASRLYANNTIRGWLHYCELRTGKETQKEHRELAQAIANELSKLLPSIFKTSKLEVRLQDRCDNLFSVCGLTCCLKRKD